MYNCRENTPDTHSLTVNWLLDITYDAISPLPLIMSNHVNFFLHSWFSWRLVPLGVTDGWETAAHFCSQPIHNSEAVACLRRRLHRLVCDSRHMTRRLQPHTSHMFVCVSSAGEMAAWWNWFRLANPQHTAVTTHAAAMTAGHCQTPVVILQKRWRPSLCKFIQQALVCIVPFGRQELTNSSGVKGFVCHSATTVLNPCLP